MIVDLVKTTATDGVKLDGALLPASGDSKINLDAIIFLHGVGSNFYGGSMFANISPPFSQNGIAVLWANTRGHDGLNTAIVTGRRRRQGACYEIVDECRHDISGWVDFLKERGHQRIGLFGHSLGAIKAVYSQAHEPHPNVVAIVAASPPRLSYSCFQNGERSAEAFATIREAEQHVHEGRAETIMDVTFPFPILITAGGYVDKYGREERYNIIKFADRLTCPTMFIYGQKELEHGGVAFAGVPDALAGLSPSCGPFEIATIPEADHSYSGTYDTLSGRMVDWLKTI